MAEGGFSEDQFTCSICLELLKDPVTIPCGHSYCMDCITNYWKEEDQKKVYSCPQCRQSLTPRPVLYKNVMLAEVVKELKKKKEQRANLSLAEAGDVECDVCTGRKYKAVKSCLMCLESYCQTHFEHHEAFRSGKRHKMIEATGRIQEMICSKHDKLLEVYCRTDQNCICLLCTMYEHKNHDTVSCSSERTEKQKQLEDKQRTFQKQIQEREKRIQELKVAVGQQKSSAQTAMKECEKIFDEMICLIEKKRSEVIETIRDREDIEVSRAEELLKMLEREIEDLKKRNAELEKLSLTEDHIQFLQKFQSLQKTSSFKPLEDTDVSISSDVTDEDVRKSVSRLKEKVEQFCKEVMEGEEAPESIYETEPKTRKDFLKYFIPLSLDRNTVNKRLCLSEGDTVATFTARQQLYPDHPERFQDYFQVSCRERVCGRCYWELEWSSSNSARGVGIAVSYKSIRRKGTREECGFGFNDQSWKLFCSKSMVCFWHNNKGTDLPEDLISSRIGVYVDERAGILSFFRISDTMILIHREQITFTQPLFAGFWLDSGSRIKICRS
ncbi:hypothetical protein DNTS_027005 [Danionella cerebrum]|uniref:RING-type domain-containing protein n=1 Tax=Danionella cerebrum TaxID=2873325 RepID=A0A553QV24_9TELE|nr:hypothetical protein DNTS_027005 [Danionella translucida]